MRRCRPALGTLVEVALLGPSHGEPSSRVASCRAFEAAFAAIDRVGRLMSFHDRTSDLSRLNARAHREPVRVDAWTDAVLRLASRVHRHSAGRFDCTVASTLVARGLLPRHAVDAEVDLDHDEPDHATFDDVELLPDQRVRYRRPLTLDLGGIAKGYAVDRAIEALQSHGVAHAIVNAGGDLRVLGDRSVPVHLRGDDGSVPYHVGDLADGAMAVSACFDATRSTRQALGALVRPHDRTLVATRRRYAVIAPECALADALTKVVAVSPSGSSAACLAAFGATALVH